MAFCKYNDVCGRFPLNTKADENLLKKDAYNVLSTKVLMSKRRACRIALILTAIIISLPLFQFSDTTHANAAQRTLTWYIVNTPNSLPGGIVVSPSEINAVALGPDNRTIYVANTDNATASLYKCSDAGVTWFPDIGNRLAAATGVQMPVWNLAVAPDDPMFVIAITGSTASGPTQVFFSSDGGSNWHNTNFTAAALEYISCVSISRLYATSGNARDIAVGTRNAAGTGSVYNTQFNSNLQGTWSKQTPLAGNIYSLKFSPNYNTDSTIVVIYFDTALKLNLGLHNTTSNTTSWNDASFGPGYPVNLNFASLASLIGTDLALPSDFSANITTQQGCFASAQTDTPAPAISTQVYYINTSLFPNVFNITPSMTTSPAGRISSIAYKGSEGSGILLAGEVFATAGRGMVNVWQSANAQSSTIGGATWTKSDDLKSPTGGAASGNTNPAFPFRANLLSIGALTERMPTAGPVRRTQLQEAQDRPQTPINGLFPN